MTAEKIAIIHTGFAKTGSSSIQYTLAHNRSLLEEHGFYYPYINIQGKEFYNCSVPLYGRYCDEPDTFQHYGYHNNLDADVANNEIDCLFENELWDKEKLVFSDEFISSLSSTELIRLRDDFKKHGYTIRIISFIREPFNLFVSVVQQHSRLQSIEDILIAGIPARNVKRIETMIDIFKTDAEFYNFENICSYKTGPAGFFFSLMGIDLAADKILRINEGMSSQAVRLQSFINNACPHLIDGNTVHPLRKAFDLVSLSKLEGAKFQLNNDEVEKIKPEILQARAVIADKLGDDFLPVVNFNSSESLNWGEVQLDYLLSIQHSLDLHLLLRIHDYLECIDMKDKVVCAQRQKFTQHLKQRLDEELILNNKENRFFIFLRKLFLRSRKVCLGAVKSKI